MDLTQPECTQETPTVQLAREVEFRIRMLRSSCDVAWASTGQAEFARQRQKQTRSFVIDFNRTDNELLKGFHHLEIHCRRDSGSQQLRAVQQVLRVHLGRWSHRVDLLSATVLVTKCLDEVPSDEPTQSPRKTRSSRAG